MATHSTTHFIRILPIFLLLRHPHVEFGQASPSFSCPWITCAEGWHLPTALVFHDLDISASTGQLVSCFVECPSIWVCLTCVVMRSRLCPFGKTTRDNIGLRSTSCLGHVPHHSNGSELSDFLCCKLAISPFGMNKYPEGGILTQCKYLFPPQTAR